MKITLSIIKADIGSIGGHICPSRQLLDTVRNYVAQHGSSLLIDQYVSSTGDDIAVYADASKTAVLATIHTLRQQTEKPQGQANLALADYVAPPSSGRVDYGAT